MKKINKKHIYLINLLFVFIPISFVFGNFFTNINLILLCLFSIFVLKKQIIEFKINFLDKLIIYFFVYILTVLSINYLEFKLTNTEFPEIIFFKTFAYLRYLIFYLILRVLIDKNILNINLFSLICLFSAIFVATDIVIQFLFGKDIFGIPSPSSLRHQSGPFGNELIAGGYLQRFGIFFLILLHWLKKNKFKNQIIIFFISLIFVGIILSGNRTPLLLFTMGLGFCFYFLTELRKYFYRVFIILFCFFIIIFYTNININVHMTNFFNNGLLLAKSFISKNINTDIFKGKPYIVEFHCSKKFIAINPIIGGGIRSYRTHPGGCLTHSHNYYLEIFVDLGLVGIFMVLFFLFVLAKKIKLYLSYFKLNAPLILPYVLVISIEFFPVRVSGSFFATNNASLIFVFLSILISTVVGYKKNVKKSI